MHTPSHTSLSLPVGSGIAPIISRMAPVCACLSALVAALLLCSYASAQTPQVQRVEVVTAGTYALQGRQTVVDPNLPTGQRDFFDSGRLTDSSTTVEGRVGTNFGFEYRVIGSPTGAKARIKRVVRIPAPGLRDPKTGKVSLVIEDPEETTIGPKVSLLSYGFDEAWEVVPGTWTFELWSGDRKLASRSFTVVKR